MAILDAHLREHAATLLLVTHDEELAGRSADRILHMKDGLLTN
jgi:predicted ABC-type transport system involved in lysophospholipase L1 biosynthesis ATPase subunit